MKECEFRDLPNSPDAKCAICMDDFESNTSVITLSCGHVFDRYFTSSNFCVFFIFCIASVCNIGLFPNRSTPSAQYVVNLCSTHVTFTRSRLKWTKSLVQTLWSLSLPFLKSQLLSSLNFNKYRGVPRFFFLLPKHLASTARISLEIQTANRLTFFPFSFLSDYSFHIWIMGGVGMTLSPKISQQFDFSIVGASSMLQTFEETIRVLSWAGNFAFWYFVSTNLPELFLGYFLEIKKLPCLND